MSLPDLLAEIRQLMQLHGENPFKIRAFEKAESIAADRDDLEQRARDGTLTELPGIGKGIAEVIREYLLEGTCSVRDELAKGLPPGLTELIKIPGLGPKKARVLIDELGIQSVAELEYACRENRLLSLKGFGVKLQQQILDNIQFHNSSRGQARLVDALPLAELLIERLRKAAGRARVELSGALRRRLEVVDRIEVLIESPGTGASVLRERLEAVIEAFRKERPELLRLTFHEAPAQRFGYALAETTGSPDHWKAIGSPAPFDAETEEEFYRKLGLPWISPEMRETGEEVALARAERLPYVLDWKGVQGIFHNHTTRSDGTATLEEMVIAAKRMGFRYIGISDHSQSAFYARGLKEDDLLEQEKEVRAVQDRHPEIRVFWGVESDILQDGSLDYPDKVLERFDFVIGSIHSRFKMEREAMTDRVLEAIRHPRTRMIGHLTGRLLLGRKGYELDIEKVIREAAAHDVAIEINAHPARLDIDWRWGAALREHGAPVCINPDAHEVAGLSDTAFGVGVARKALLPAAQIVNARSVEEVEKWLRR